MKNEFRLLSLSDNKLKIKKLILCWQINFNFALKLCKISPTTYAIMKTFNEKSHAFVNITSIVKLFDDVEFK